MECSFGTSIIFVGLSETNYSFFLRKCCIFVAIKKQMTMQNDSKQGPKYFSYNGKILDDLRTEIESLSID